MNIVEIDTYTQNGCNIRPCGGLKLYQIDYSEVLQNLPRYGEFGAMSTFDALDMAKDMMKENFPNAKVLLGIPILVFEA